MGHQDDLCGAERIGRRAPLFVSGYEGMMQREPQIPDAGKVRLAEVLDRLVQLYTDWGKPAQAAEWEQKLTELAAPTDGE